MNLGLVLENHMGHATHAQNLVRCLQEDPQVQPTYVRVPLENTPALWRRLPVIRSQQHFAVRMSLEARWALRAHARSLDALFFHTQSTALFSQGLMRRLPSIVSLDATPRQHDALYGKKLSNDPRVEALKERRTARVFAAASHLVTWSQWAKNSLVSDYGIPEEKVTVIPPGVDTSRFVPAPAAKLNDGVVRLLFVGGDFARKGGDLLLQWARETAVKQPWELHLVTGADVPETPGVIAHRHISNNSPELIRLYQQSDIFVLPTRADTTGIVNMEAAAAGLPTVTTRIAGVPEVVQEGVTGSVVEPGDSAALTASLDRLVCDAVLRIRLGDAARRKALAEFEGAANYARLIGLIKEVASQQPANRA